MEPPRVLSVSQVNAYIGCPLKYRFQYVDKIPRPWRVAAMAFGTSVHAGVEWFHRERMAGRSPELKKVLEVFDADWYAQNVEPLVFSEKESKDSLAEKGRGMLQLYVESCNGANPVAVEQYFELDLADPETGEVLDVRLRGVIDLVEEGDVLVDLKTAKPRLERHETTRSLEDLGWTARLIKEVAVAIETEHFFPNPSWRCTECEYFAHCQRWRGWEPPRVETLVTVGGEGAGKTATQGSQG